MRIGICDFSSVPGLVWDRPRESSFARSGASRRSIVVAALMRNLTSSIVVVAVPLNKYRTLAPDLLAGRTVIDAMNYWAPIDGEIDEFENDERTSSEIVQAYLSGSDVVKTLNHIGYHDLEEDGRLPGSEDRRALALAGGNNDAKALVAGFIDRLGYDPVDAGPLESGRAFQPGTEIFNGSHSATQLRSILAADREPARA